MHLPVCPDEAFPDRLDHLHHLPFKLRQGAPARLDEVLQSGKQLLCPFPLFVGQSYGLELGLHRPPEVGHLAPQRLLGIHQLLDLGCAPGELLSDPGKEFQAGLLPLDERLDRSGELPEALPRHSRQPGVESPHDLLEGSEQGLGVSLGHPSQELLEGHPDLAKRAPAFVAMAFDMAHQGFAQLLPLRPPEGLRNSE